MTINEVIVGLDCIRTKGNNGVSCHQCPFYNFDDCNSVAADEATMLLKAQQEQLDELEPPKKWITCQACGHKLRDDWVWCPWCRWETRNK